jgi:predicted  nucleic acid-binding Zn-ribbon protein
MTKIEKLVAELTQEEEKYASIMAQISAYKQKKYHTQDQEQWYTKATRAKLFTEANIKRIKREIELERDDVILSYRKCYAKLQELLPPELFQEFIKNSNII